MLNHTFCHLPGVGPLTEGRLWDLGVRTWDDWFHFATRGQKLPGGVKSRTGLERSRLELANANAIWFGENLPSSESWRMFPDFMDSVAYLDIETTGMGFPGDHITSIALYDGRTVRTYVHGRNLAEFEDDITAYKLLVTYNGKGFDVPFIEREFRTRIRAAHIDLRWTLKSLGYTGGLKGCEKAFGICREELEGVDGYFAVLLWKRFRETRDERYLETMLAYNVADVTGLELLMRQAFNAKLAGTVFGPELELEVPAPHPNPYLADLRVIDEIRSGYSRLEP